MKQRGFTLIELLLVISILSFLASIILTSLSSARAKARDSERIQEMRQIQTALELYRQANNSYPVSRGVMSSLVLPGLTPTYISAIPTDPTGNDPYMYCNHASSCVVAGQGVVIDPDPLTYAIRFTLETDSSFGPSGHYCVTSTKIYPEINEEIVDQKCTQG
jgi:type II secretion system protein G